MSESDLHILHRLLLQYGQENRRYVMAARNVAEVAEYVLEDALAATHAGDPSSLQSPTPSSRAESGA